MGATRASRTRKADSNGMRCFNQLSQSAVYREDEISVSVTVCGGSYGGGSEVLVIESNQEHATISDTEVCTTLTASMGLGGGYVPMILTTSHNSMHMHTQIDISASLAATDHKDPPVIVRGGAML